MKYSYDLSGRTFGRLTPVEPIVESHRQGRLWRCRCECGKEIVLHAARLIEGHTASCGCLREEVAREAAKKLTQPVWPRMCKSCKADFTGTARQQFCGPRCKPSSPQSKYRRKRPPDTRTKWPEGEKAEEE